MPITPRKSQAIEEPQALEELKSLVKSCAGETH
jgi:hypothetical protein